MCLNGKGFYHTSCSLELAEWSCKRCCAAAWTTCDTSGGGSMESRESAVYAAAKASDASDMCSCHVGYRCRPRRSLHELLATYEGEESASKELIDELLAHTETHEAIYSIVLEPLRRTRYGSSAGEDEQEDNEEGDDEESGGRLTDDDGDDNKNGSAKHNHQAHSMQLAAHTRRYLGLV